MTSIGAGDMTWHLRAWMTVAEDQNLVPRTHVLLL